MCKYFPHNFHIQNLRFKEKITKQEKARFITENSGSIELNIWPEKYKGTRFEVVHFHTCLYGGPGSIVT